MSKEKSRERITNEDGSSLKVITYEDKVVVHEKDPEGNPKGHVTDWFDNPGIHITDENGNQHWEGASPEESNSETSSSSNDDTSDEDEENDDSDDREE